jgi:CHASE2 domain-containing sensor protein
VPSFVVFTVPHTAKKLTAKTTSGFITGECSGGLIEMKCLFVILIILFLGPLRHWVGRHWALLFSTAMGAVIGLFIGGYIAAQCGSSYAWLPLVGAVIGVATAGKVGPEWLRNIERDGKNGHASRRH